MEFNKIKSVTAIAILGITALLSSAVNAQTTFNIQKRNTNHSIDGNHGAVVGTQVYLWQTNNNNVNQQWIEIDRGNGFFSYQKMNTNVCLDGGNGGSRAQPVILFDCRSTNRNQHWKKISTSGGTFRLQKRNAPGFSIDGNRGAGNRQAIYLWNSQNNNVNQQWNFRALTNDSELPDDVHEDIVRIADIPASDIVRNPGGESWKDSYSVGDRCYCDTTFDHDIGDIRVDTPVGNLTVRQVCDQLGDGPGSDGRPIYNDVQCGNGPANDAGDEDYCPGRVDIGREGCTHIGPVWNFD